MADRPIHVHVHESPASAGGLVISPGWLITGTAIGCLVLGAYAAVHAPADQAQRAAFATGPEGAGVPPPTGARDSGPPSPDNASGVIYPPEDDEPPGSALRAL